MTDDLEFVEVEVPPVVAAQLAASSAPDPASINVAIHAAFATMGGFLARHALTPSGAPRIIYTSMGPDGVPFILAWPLASAPEPPADEPPVTIGPLPGRTAYRFTHRGPYQNLMQTYGRIGAFMKEKGYMSSDADWARYMPMWEEYVNDPAKTPAADLLTYIYLPVA